MIHFSSLPMNTSKADYDSKILPKLTKVFGDIRGMTFLNFDPAALARAELEWWVARRDPKRLDFETVGNLMTKTYVLLYGGKDTNYRKPAYLRAFAARYRDVCQDLLEKDWQLVELILTAGYECLENNLQKQAST